MNKGRRRERGKPSTEKTIQTSIMTTKSVQKGTRNPHPMRGHLTKKSRNGERKPYEVFLPLREGTM